MDVIFLSGLTTECIIGIWDWERRVQQKIVIDLEMARTSAGAAAPTRSRHARLQARRQAAASPS